MPDIVRTADVKVGAGREPQDAADADEAQDGHLDGMPAAGGCGKLVQPIRRGGDLPGGTSFTWLHMCFLPASQAVVH